MKSESVLSLTGNTNNGVKKHGGNWKNNTDGPMIDRKKMIEDHIKNK
jgi:hypothetical protein